MNCPICKHGRRREDTVTVTLERAGVTVVFKWVPPGCARTAASST